MTLSFSLCGKELVIANTTPSNEIKRITDSCRPVALASTSENPVRQNRATVRYIANLLNVVPRESHVSATITVNFHLCQGLAE